MFVTFLKLCCYYIWHFYALKTSKLYVKNAQIFINIRACAEISKYAIRAIKKKYAVQNYQKTFIYYLMKSSLIFIWYKITIQKINKYFIQVKILLFGVQ